MFRESFFGAVCLSLLAGAAPPADPVRSFGARESVQQIGLSPSGTKVAFISPGQGQGNVLYTVDLPDGVPKRTLASSGDPDRLSWCNWVSDERLVCKAYFLTQDGADLVPFTRMLAVDAGGGNMKLLSREQREGDLAIALGGGEVIDWLPETDGSVLIARTYVQEVNAGSHIADKRQGFGVDRLDTRTLSSKGAVTPRPSAIEYISDGLGNVRIMGLSPLGSKDQSTGIIQYQFRPKGSDEWKPLGTYNSVTGEGFNPYAVDPATDVVYGFMKKDGRLAVYATPLDGSGASKLVYAHPEVDVDELVRIGRNGRVVGVTFATEKRQAVYFDPELTRLAASLSKALPNLPLIRFVDSSVDESKLLLWAGSDVDPGTYYLYDKKAKNLAEVLPSRPELQGAQLASVKPITYRAADGTMVPGYLTLPPGGAAKNLPALVMPHGGPGARDEWGFDWLAQYFASRGYAVLQPNFRGSTGYGDSWFQNNGFQSWKTAIGDVNDAGRWLVAEGVADPAKLAIFGWSYGGYAALQANVLDPSLFKAAVAVAPVTDLAMLAREWAGWSNQRLIKRQIGSGPHVKEGSPAQNAERITVPVLMFHGERDRNVGVGESRFMADKLKGAGKKVELVVYPKLDHYLNDNDARMDMLRRSDAFLRASLKLP